MKISVIKIQILKEKRIGISAKKNVPFVVLLQLVYVNKLLQTVYVDSWRQITEDVEFCERYFRQLLVC